jgi:hypothetical protein
VFSEVKGYFNLSYTSFQNIDELLASLLLFIRNVNKTVFDINVLLIQ